MSDFPQEISPNQLKEWLNEGRSLTLLDVRNPDEVEICKIGGSINLPLTDLLQGQSNINTDYPIVTICHHGVRSRQAMFFLRQQGIQDVTSLQGGVDVWAREIDPTMKRY